MTDKQCFALVLATLIDDSRSWSQDHFDTCAEMAIKIMGEANSWESDYEIKENQ